MNSKLIFYQNKKEYSNIQKSSLNQNMEESMEPITHNKQNKKLINSLNFIKTNYYSDNNMDKNENLNLKKIKKFATKTSVLPKNNIYFKGKIKKSLNNNNIIINNNTNIINNNNINIINNNIINSNNDIINTELNRSLSQINVFPIQKSDENTNIRNNNLYINKNNIKNKTKNMIFNKRIINLDNNNTKTSNDKNNNYNNIPSNNYINNNNNQKENSVILNVEEILMIEEKLSSLINCLINRNPCAEESFECINFYFTTKFSKNVNEYFIKENVIKIVNKALNIKIFSFIISYDISLNEDIFPNYVPTLKDIFTNVHNILILISKHFCSKIIGNSSNLWVKKLNNLTQKYSPDIKAGESIFDEINNISKFLLDKLFPNLLQRYKKPLLIDIFKKINLYNQFELQRIYKEKIFVNMNINGSIIGSSAYFQRNQNYLNSQKFSQKYYLNKNPSKEYTLVLDLDETLIHFKGNPNDDSSGLLQFRPYLSEFLLNISKFYELVVFTAATKDYADPIIEAIEKKGQFFEYRLYRMHTIVINNDFVKDLSRLGRDMSRIIIVDNMEQNYKLQPDNGITIRPFWGKDSNDMALIDLLDILIKIAKNKMDVREGISLFKEDIISKVTSNIFRRVQY